MNDFSEGTYLNDSYYLSPGTIKLSDVKNSDSLGYEHVTNGVLSCAPAGGCGGWSSG